MKNKQDQAHDERDRTVDMLNTHEGMKNFADCVLRTAFVSHNEPHQEETMETCGKMLALVHPSAVFWACMNIMQSGMHVEAERLVEMGEATEDDGYLLSVKGSEKASHIIADMIDATNYWNKEDVCRCLREVPVLMDNARIAQELSGEETDGNMFAFDWLNGRVTIKDEEETDNE